MQTKFYKAYSIIIAVGSHSKELNIEGEKEYKGRGVSYCALCDGNFLKIKMLQLWVLETLLFQMRCICRTFVIKFMYLQSQI